MQKRRELLREKISGRRVGGILITDPVNVRYLSGFTGSSGFIIITRKHSLFVTDFRYGEQARSEVKGYTIRIERSERTGEIKDICDEYGIRTLGFEDHNVTFGFYRKLLKRKIKLRPFTGLVGSLRAVKSRQELACIRKAVSRAESAFQKLLPLIKTGVTERKLALKLEEFLRKEGCKTLPFEVIVASGPMSALPHARPSDRKLRKGDLVVFDWGGEYNGYFSDMTRTVLMRGRSISRQKELYYTVLEARNRAIKSVRPGIRSAAVDGAARDYIRAAGYGDFFGHGTGHGVGLAVHEKPVVSWRNREIIEKNMVFTVEPGIYVPGFGGVRIEDMVAVGKKKADVLTSLTGNLMIIAR